MKKGIGELLNECAKLATRKEKIEFLQKNYSPAMGLIMQAALDPAIKWNLPPGEPPYKPLGGNMDQQYMLYQQAKKLSKFYHPPHGTYLHLTKNKRELLFIQLLEACEPEDAELLINAKDKKFPYKGLTVALINNAFPGLINVTPTTDKENGQDS